MMMTTIETICAVDAGTCEVTLRGPMTSNVSRSRQFPCSVRELVAHLHEYARGALIQVAFHPHQFSASDREFLLTGLTDDEWLAMQSASDFDSDY